jgi:hypothetical protein
MKSPLWIFALLFFNSVALCQKSEIIITTLDPNKRLIGESVVFVGNKTAEQIYNSLNEWVSFTFTNTESVVQAKIENKMMRINGVSKSVLGPFMGFYFDLGYTIQVEIKDGRFKFSVTNLTQISPRAPYSKYPLDGIFNNKGEIKSARKYQDAKSQIDAELNKLLFSLKSSIDGSLKLENDNW